MPIKVAAPALALQEEPAVIFPMPLAARVASGKACLD